MVQSHPPLPDLPQLVEQYYVLLYRFAYRLSGSVADAEDLTQQAFLTAQTKLYQLRSADRVQSWLLTIVRNTYLKQQRRQSRQRVSLESIAEPDCGLADDTEVDPEQLQRILNEMPEDFRAVIILFYFRELSYKQIAETVKVPIGTVMSRLARGKQYLKKKLTTQCLSADLLGDQPD
jgi:RNA polymerase sigma-70 factor (ECF subfamily)